VVAFGASLEVDLARRDFTINALAYHPLRQEWRDPFGGEADLGQKLIRAVGNPQQRFREDYLRILRALRFAARFDFAIEPATWTAARDAAEGLPSLSAERVRDEWFKGLRTARSLATLVRLWWDSGAAALWLPQLISIAEPAGAPDGPAAVLARLEARRAAPLSRDPVLLTALLCREPVAVLGRLKASRAEIGRAAAIVTGPAEPDAVTPLAVRRWLAAVGDAADDLSVIWQLRHGIAPQWIGVMRGIRERGEPLTRKALAITGDDLIAAGMTPSPALGAILDQLLGQVVDDPSLNSREILLARARSLT
jgi:tRNA nucleotidyltransferase (CCA-adding enzyme)